MTEERHRSFAGLPGKATRGGVWFHGAKSIYLSPQGIYSLQK